MKSLMNMMKDAEQHKMFSYIPVKPKYTKSDVNRLQVQSLFVRCEGGPLSEKDARFMVFCKAFTIGAQYSEYVKGLSIVCKN